MSGNFKDKIVNVLDNIVNKTKDENLLLGDLQELLFELKNITVFDGLQLFLNYVENQGDTLSIEIFLFKHLDDLSMFPLIFNAINSKRGVLQEALDKEKSEMSFVDLKSTAVRPSEGSKGFLQESDEKESLVSRSARNDKLLDELYADEEMIDSKPKSSKSKPMPPPSPMSAPAPSPGAPVPSPKPASMKAESGKEQKLAKTINEKKKAQKKSAQKIMEVTRNIQEESELQETGKRGLLVDYYSRMNINSVYDFTVKIDKEMLQARKKQSDLLTGEQREQLTDEITVVEDKPIEIELQIPGALVTPNIHYVSPDPKSSQVTFFVTPYVKFSKKMGKLVIGQEKLTKKTIEFNVSVIDRRLMKIISILGILIASLPSIWPVLFGIDLNGYLVTNASNYMTFVTNTTILPLEVGLGGFITVLSLLILKLYSSKRTSFTSTQLF